MLKKTNGITLIALIITIIVMLILVAVTVSVVINSNLIGTAQNAADRTEAKYQEESSLGNVIEINGKKYWSMEDYVAGIEKAPDIMGGKGTEADPYTIDSIEALVQFAHSVTNGKTYAGEYVKLTRNLDFESADSYLDSTRTDYEQYGYTGALMTALTTGEGFKQIGATESTEFQAHSFAGTFDGNGKSITNLLISKEEISGKIGLFAFNYGIIKNLGVADCKIYANSIIIDDGALDCGSMCAFNCGEINSCWSSGNINISASGADSVRVGGITGGSSGSVKNCYNKTNIESEHNGTFDIRGRRHFWNEQWNC